jgi:hypothetical protein
MTERKTRKQTAPEPIEDAALDQASGGILIGMLLPAVQKVREASPSDPSLPAGSNLVVSAGPGAGPH